MKDSTAPVFALFASVCAIAAGADASEATNNATIVIIEICFLLIVIISNFPLVWLSVGAADEGSRVSGFPDADAARDSPSCPDTRASREQIWGF